MNLLQYESPVGPLFIAENGRAVTHIGFTRPDGGLDERPTPLLGRCREQLDGYFAGKRQTFDLPLEPSGTPFQRRVWQALMRIPYGHTWTYKELALAAGSPKGYRAVGLANNRNPIVIVIPCHRVIGSDGSLTGYGGGLAVKEKLLALEAVSL